MKSSLLVLLFFFSFLLTSSSILAAIPAHRCHPDDQRVLLQIKNHFGNSSLFSTWDPQKDCCKWRIISCKKIPKSTVYRVNFLEIDGADDLVGRIPSLVGHLPYLETLIFRNLPHLSGPIPEAISNLTHLKLLLLNWNNLTGPVPDFLSRLPNIGDISLNDNRLSGPIPASLGRLRNLKGLELYNNNLTGEIPESFGAFQPGSQLSLSNNRLSGPIPRSLGRVNFGTLKVAGNELEGDASFLFGENKTELVQLDLSRNRLSFDLTNVVMPVGEPTWIMFELDLSHNMIYGRLPAWLGRVPGLYQFNVSYNQLCGPIPTAGGKLQGFDKSSFGHNKCLCGAPLAPCKLSPPLFS